EDRRARTCKQSQAPRSWFVVIRQHAVESAPIRLGRTVDRRRHRHHGRSHYRIAIHIGPAASRRAVAARAGPLIDLLGHSQMSKQSVENRTWRRFALPISILLNLFLVALIGGHLLRHRSYDVAAGSPSLPRILANAQASLSAPDAATFGTVMRRDAPRYLESARQLVQARAALEHQITAQPFDAVAAKEAFA